MNKLTLEYLLSNQIGGFNETIEVVFQDLDTGEIYDVREVKFRPEAPTRAQGPAIVIRGGIVK